MSREWAQVTARLRRRQGGFIEDMCSGPAMSRRIRDRRRNTQEWSFMRRPCREKTEEKTAGRRTIARARPQSKAGYCRRLANEGTHCHCLVGDGLRHTRQEKADKFHLQIFEKRFVLDSVFSNVAK